ncbi:MAG TPA: cupredoxin domain-containing protein [Acidisoma sp.]|jgi:plastocyanin|uniref:cupredoxin domain-containing protein n=1 Tax=Acidisoma sp. TaxID=1872115 RepID=UPI002CDA560C|nr:cupredoxin domain-containing protein [Acidisoma sp.]HTI01082.1 cupredoxin domain-containing protein [Acidisoma sp.]
MLKTGLAAVCGFLLTVSASQAATVKVIINNYMFMPDRIVAHPGDVILFSNQDTDPHTATSLDGKSFDSNTIDPGSSWSFTVKAVGTYKFHCAIHPDMLGEIDVQ